MKKVRYRHIRSLADLRAERQRISDEIEDLEDRLQDDYHSISEMFSISYVAGRIAQQTSVLYNIVEYAQSGYEFVRRIYDKVRRKPAEEETAAGDNSGGEDCACSADGGSKTAKAAKAKAKSRKKAACEK